MTANRRLQAIERRTRTPKPRPLTLYQWATLLNYGFHFATLMRTGGVPLRRDQPRVPDEQIRAELLDRDAHALHTANPTEDGCLACGTMARLFGHGLRDNLTPPPDTWRTLRTADLGHLAAWVEQLHPYFSENNSDEMLAAIADVFPSTWFTA